MSDDDDSDWKSEHVWWKQFEPILASQLLGWTGRQRATFLPLSGESVHQPILHLPIHQAEAILIAIDKERTKVTAKTTTINPTDPWSRDDPRSWPDWHEELAMLDAVRRPDISEALNRINEMWALKNYTLQLEERLAKATAECKWYKARFDASYTEARDNTAQILKALADLKRAAKPGET